MTKEVRVLDESKPLIPFVYQAELVKRTIDTVANSNKKSAFTVSPPGSGKTLIMATIAKLFTDQGKKVMFTVHRIEIIRQAEKTFKRQGVNMDLVKFGMIQTLTRREIEVKTFNPDIVFVDEAHHAAAESYLRVLRWLPKAYKFYFTATPWRGDGKGFEELANNNDLVLGPSVDWLIKRNYLSDFDYYVKTLYDKTKLVVGRNGDYQQDSIIDQAKEVDIDQIVDTYLEKSNNEPAIVYAGSIEQSKNIVEEFNARGIPAAHLDGGSESEYREEQLQAFKEGKIKVISNVQIFTEGVDLPDASVALIARPTKSIALYYQFAMRVLRYKEGKHAKIIDFAGVANELGLPNADRKWSLLSRDLGANKFEEKKPYLFECNKCNKTWGVKDVIKETEFVDNSVVLTIRCPEDHEVIEVRRSKRNEPEFAELQEIINKKEFAEEWYKHASIARNQDLRTNAKILKTQHPNISDKDIFVELLKTYIPNFSKDTPLEKVTSVKQFLDEEIDDMIDYLGGGEKEKALFNQMFETRKQVVTQTYANKIDLTTVIEDNDLIDLFKEKVKMVKHESEIYGDKVTSNDVLKRIAEDAAQAVYKNQDIPSYRLKKNQLKEFSIRLRMLNLVSKQAANDVYIKSLQDLDIIQSDRKRNIINSYQKKHTR